MQNLSKLKMFERFNAFIKVTDTVKRVGLNITRLLESCDGVRKRGKAKDQKVIIWASNTY